MKQVKIGYSTRLIVEDATLINLLEVLVAANEITGYGDSLKVTPVEFSVSEITYEDLTPITDRERAAEEKALVSERRWLDMYNANEAACKELAELKASIDSTKGHIDA